MGVFRKIRVGILSSSRADFGIYLPLLNQLKKESDYFETSIIAFGTHLSTFHGSSIDDIYRNGFKVAFTVKSFLITDDEESISTSYALTALKFSSFWEKHKHLYDIVFCLGDRFEMAAAVASGLPFNIPFAHIHGGETTLGAIDNIYRHSISLASEVHFVSTHQYYERLMSLLGDKSECHLVGALSLDNIDNIELPEKRDFTKRWGINPSTPFMLFTFHPETKGVDSILGHIEEIRKLLLNCIKLCDIVITMPNADTNGSLLRELYSQIHREFTSNVTLIENFGTKNYFAAMQYCSLVVGNSSSGIIEAASFGKYVIDLGDRQKGRAVSDNVIRCQIDCESAFQKVKQYFGNDYSGSNIYKTGKAAELILKQLKKREY